ncbi:NFACT family protein [Priestia filamentosa]|uniref:Rqc2 family fibronectin-binding protein n=1 Tax=Priestia filamentosa TaxID=1402861 RepID=UPI0005891EC1|nr:NFACT RNA binding domain-containing protein [Priestia filamentosa]
MSFDGMFTYAMKEELVEKLQSGRITKVYQPFTNELILGVRAGGTNYKLLLSAHPSYARVHLTNESYENPSTPPMFCMLLRKHLEGGIIDSIEQIELDRILKIEVRGRDELGDVTHKALYIEIMNRHSNIILVDHKKETIIDSIKHLSPSVNSHRTVLPGHSYVFPPAQNKENPFQADEETVLRKVDFNSGKLDGQLVSTFEGVSPLLAREIIHTSGLANRTTVPKAFVELMAKIKEKEFTPQIIRNEGKEAFYMIPLTHIEGEVSTFSLLSEALDRFYYGKAERDRVKQQAHDLLQFMNTEKKKNEKKIKKLKTTLDDAEKAKKFQLYGELLTSNLFAIKQGDRKAEVINYYDENAGTVTIELDPQKTPSQNAQHYFHRYQKAKNSVTVVQEQIQKATEEIQYFETLIQQMESATHRDIAEIRQELTEEGYLKKKKETKVSKKQKNQTPQLEAYESSDGYSILVGKNNKQNDYLTNRVAGRDELWFHTKDIPGSHVVIRDTNPSEEAIREAAHLAAYFSKAKQSSSVPVDYTKVRHVKKPSGSKPGFVIYEQQQTVFVTPSEELVLKLRK